MHGSMAVASARHRCSAPCIVWVLQCSGHVHLVLPVQPAVRQTGQSGIDVMSLPALLLPLQRHPNRHPPRHRQVSTGDGAHGGPHMLSVFCLVHLTTLHQQLLAGCKPAGAAGGAAGGARGGLPCECWPLPWRGCFAAQRRAASICADLCIELAASPLLPAPRCCMLAASLAATPRDMPCLAACTAWACQVGADRLGNVHAAHARLTASVLGLHAPIAAYCLPKLRSVARHAILCIPALHVLLPCNLTNAGLNPMQW